MNELEKWFLNKISKKPTTFWAKIGFGVLLFLASIVFFIKYNYVKSQVNSDKTKNVLAVDDKKDAVLQQKLDSIKNQKSNLIKEIIKSDSNINIVDGNISKTKNKGSADLKFVESLEDWDDVEKRIK